MEERIMNANNIVSLVGRLTKDVTLHYTPEGIAVANFILAVNRPFAKDGQQEADFVNVKVWRKPAENLANYCGKGSRISLVGSIQTRSYDGQDGKKNFVTEIVADNIQFLEAKKENNNQQHGYDAQQGRPQNQRQAGHSQDFGQNQFNQRPDNGFNSFEDPFADNFPLDLSEDDTPWA